MKKKYFIHSLSIAATIWLLSSCSFDPIDKRYNKHTAEDDFRRIKEISDLDSNDVDLLAKFMVNHDLVGHQVLELHATYKDILNEAKKEKERSEIERIKKGKNNEIDIAKSHEKTKVKNIKKVLFVDFVKRDTTLAENILSAKKAKKAAAANPNIIVYEVMFKNVGQEKAIKAFKGDLNFYDPFHADLKKIQFSSFQIIGVGDSIVKRFEVNLEELNTGERVYNSLQREHIKVEWLPDRLVFEDDEIIE